MRQARQSSTPWLPVPLDASNDGTSVGVSSQLPAGLRIPVSNYHLIRSRTVTISPSALLAAKSSMPTRLQCYCTYCIACTCCVDDIARGLHNNT
ncbi:hypothetical protein LY76DRAFT_376469 [Colletotrichum caudatum]|nr:hypothetical protein LY76DRAFT_376469 [Colletotrichum caudatum]